MQAERDLLPSRIQNYPPLPAPVPICPSWFSCQQVMGTCRKKRQNMQALKCRAQSISAASSAPCQGLGISLPISKSTPPVADPRTCVPHGCTPCSAGERRQEVPPPFLLCSCSLLEAALCRRGCQSCDSAVPVQVSKGPQPSRAGDGKVEQSQREEKSARCIERACSQWR